MNDRIPQVGETCGIFLTHSITKKCASVQKIGMVIELSHYKRRELVRGF